MWKLLSFRLFRCPWPTTGRLRTCRPEKRALRPSSRAGFAEKSTLQGYLSSLEHPSLLTELRGAATFKVQLIMSVFLQLLDSIIPLLAYAGHNFSLCLAKHLSWNISEVHTFHPCELLAFVLAYGVNGSGEVHLDVLKKAFETTAQDLIARKRWTSFSRAISSGFFFAVKALRNYVEVGFLRPPRVLPLKLQSILSLEKWGSCQSGRQTELAPMDGVQDRGGLRPWSHCRISSAFTDKSSFEKLFRVKNFHSSRRGLSKTVPGWSLIF